MERRNNTTTGRGEAKARDGDGDGGRGRRRGGRGRGIGRGSQQEETSQPMRISPPPAQSTFPPERPSASSRMEPRGN